MSTKIKLVFGFLGLFLCIFFSIEEKNRKEIVIRFKCFFLSTTLILGNFPGLTFTSACDKSLQNDSVNKNQSLENKEIKQLPKGGLATPHPKDLEQSIKDREAYSAHQEALRTEAVSKELRKAAEEAAKAAEEAAKAAEEAAKKAKDLELKAIDAEEKAKLAAEKSSEAQKESRVNYEEEERLREQRKKLREEEYRKKVVSLPPLSDTKNPTPKKEKGLRRFFTWPWQP